MYYPFECIKCGNLVETYDNQFAICNNCQAYYILLNQEYATYTFELHPDYKLSPNSTLQYFIEIERDFYFLREDTYWAKPILPEEKE